MKTLLLLLLVLKGELIYNLELDYLSCGLEPDAGARIETVKVDRFPWLGILYYNFESNNEIDRATTMVILIQRQFVLGSSADISSIPKHKLRTNTRVLVGAGWHSASVKSLPGHKVVGYAIHPEYRARTLNTLAVVKLETAVRSVIIWPICPPTASHLEHTPLFNVIINDVRSMKKVLRAIKLVKKPECDEFYRSANLSYSLMRPTMSICAVDSSERASCLWEGGSGLASRDPWGRWRLVGFGVRGPGCGAPSRYIDIISYLPWIQSTFESKTQLLSLRRKASNKLMLRRQYKIPWGGRHGYSYREANSYGDCETTDTTKLGALYDEVSKFTCDQLQPVTGHYKFSLIQNVNYTCIHIETISAVNAAQPYVWVENKCPNAKGRQLCHVYDITTGVVKLGFVFTFRMTLIVQYLGIPLRGLRPPDSNFNETDLPNAKAIKEMVIRQWQDNAMR